MKHAVGSLVQARNREWVVQPDSTDDVLYLRPLGGTNIESTIILTSLEPVLPATFGLPNPEHLGDLQSARYLRDAVRIGFRSSTGPFRSLAGIAVEPRSYQLVPLLMALRLEPVRMLIADDVGIGKTIEAALIAKELYVRGEVQRICVLCPPHLAEQWQSELSSKFGLEPTLVLPSTVRSLEKRCAPGESIFEVFPVTIVSLDYIKQANRKDDFARTCPEFVIVDEAHTCTDSGQGAQQQRYKLLKQLADNPKRHMVLVTATPHSGNNDAFRSLLRLLNKSFEALPEDLSGEHNRKHRTELAKHLVQRRRSDIKRFLDEDTPFPKRIAKDVTYTMDPKYRAFLDKALAFAREVVSDKSGTAFQQRVRWYAALSMLRSISSSPRAAVATLTARAASLEAAGDQDETGLADDLGRRGVFDLDDVDEGDYVDTAPGAIFDDNKDNPAIRKLRDLAELAADLTGANDQKAIGIVKLVKELLRDGYAPIVFCRFIQTAEYLAEVLQKEIPRASIGCVTGTLAHDEREVRVEDLSDKAQRVLVCTDCLSEGINLQKAFNAIIHADLGWTPTRHEQREGRVDRFGQKSDDVRIITYYGEDNPIDGIILRVIVRRYAEIKTQLGYSVPVPVDTDKVLGAIFEANLMTGSNKSGQLSFDILSTPESVKYVNDWTADVEKEKKNRTVFAQTSIKAEEVKPELDAMREALGNKADVQAFVDGTVRDLGGKLTQPDSKGVFTVDLDACLQTVRDAVEYKGAFKATYSFPPPKNVVSLGRVQPFVENLANIVLEEALEGSNNAIAKRCGVTATNAVTKRTILLLVRNRYQIETASGELLAEDVSVTGFTGNADDPSWLLPEDAELLMDAKASGNVGSDIAKVFLKQVVSMVDRYLPELSKQATIRAAFALESHRRVRAAMTGAQAAKGIKVQGEPDILGLYVFIPGQTS
jgi:superfamily II DNA or RNA helicase